jgi:hypothetical protein
MSAAFSSTTTLSRSHAGGKSTVENVRLLCRTHNQYAAECAFGAEFMERKRREARQSVRTGSRP